VTDAERKLRNNLGHSWYNRIGDFMRSDEVKSVARAVNARRNADGVNVLPNREQMFRAFRLTAFEDTKVVILGAEPFSNEHFVDGLAYSCPDIFDAPEVCRTINTAIIRDIHKGKSESAFIDTNLQRWAEQGVLLLNMCLTTEEGSEFAHQKLGWEVVAKECVRQLAEDDEPRVFMAWGMAAKNMILSAMPEENNHIVLESVHANDLEFLMTNCFSKANEWLESTQFTTIKW
jgi:uracil-DNA glycosylase